MQKKYKRYLKINIVSLFFIVVSFISITLAWFAYSGIATVNTEIGVKAWYIEFQKNDEAVSNDIIISLSEIYPGMDPVNEIVNIKNKGDSDASLKYKIVSVRILDEEQQINGNEASGIAEDQLSHDYPFHLNINLSKNYVLSKDEDSVFNVSISWPLDSDTDTLDSNWGTKAYQFQQQEELKKQQDSSYQVRSSLKVVISVTAEQYVETPEASDTNYDLGKTVLYDVATNRSCTVVGDTCIRTHVIDVNSKLSDKTVTLLPDLETPYQQTTFDNYNSTLENITAAWNVPTRNLTVKDLAVLVSNDVTNSLLVRENISDSILGYLKDTNRIDKELEKLINYNGYYKFNNYSYIYLTSSNCYWTETNYNDTKAFAVSKIDNLNSKIYGENKTNLCEVVPVIIAPKSNI